MSYGYSDYKKVILSPGQLHLASEPTLITTVLGSCVSICLYSVRDSVGAMSHSVLAVPRYLKDRNDIRYVECAAETMLDGMSGLGVPLANIKAKLYGGAEMFHAEGRDPSFARIVGEGNVKAARMILDKMGIPIESECVGGMLGRRLVFETATGLVLVQKLGQAMPVRQYEDRISRVA